MRSTSRALIHISDRKAPRAQHKKPTLYSKILQEEDTIASEAGEKKNPEKIDWNCLSNNINAIGLSKKESRKN